MKTKKIKQNKTKIVDKNNNNNKALGCGQRTQTMGVARDLEFVSCTKYQINITIFVQFCIHIAYSFEMGRYIKAIN